MVDEHLPKELADMDLSLLALFLVLIIFAFLLAYIFRLHNEKRELASHLHLLKNSSDKRQPSIEAQQILHDLTAHGQAVVRIIPLSPTDIFWRSPH